MGRLNMIELTTDQLCILLAVDGIIAIVAIVGAIIYLRGGEDE